MRPTTFRPGGASLAVLLVAVAVAALALAGCSAAPMATPAPAAPVRSEAPAPAAAPPGSSASRPAQPATSANQSTANLPTDQRMIVRNATLSLVVVDVDKTLADVSKLATEMDGFVVTSDGQETDGGMSGKAVIRIPTDRLDEAMGRIKGMAQRVRREQITAQDVTEEFSDQDARLKALRAQEAQYLEILKSARTVEDVLKVQTALGTIRQDIERTQGRMQYLQRVSATATITMDFATASVARPLVEGGWDPLEVAQGAVKALLSVLIFLLSLVIVVAVFTPIWLPILLLVRRARRNARAKRGAPPAAPPTPPTAPAPAA